MEEKLESLLSLLTSNQAAKDKPELSTVPEATPSQEIQLPATAPLLMLPGAAEITSNNAFTPSESTSSIYSDTQNLPLFPTFSFPNFDTFQDAISKGIIDLAQAEESLQYFKTRAFNFPFVIVPAKISLDSLRHQRPFLLLAILSLAAEEGSKVQCRLELELRETLSRKVIINAEKSLDLLQGILVYLAW